jgi:hypothetical protein
MRLETPKLTEGEATGSTTTVKEEVCDMPLKPVTV